MLVAKRLFRWLNSTKNPPPFHQKNKQHLKSKVARDVQLILVFDDDNVDIVSSTIRGLCRPFSTAFKVQVEVFPPIQVLHRREPTHAAEVEAEVGQAKESRYIWASYPAEAFETASRMITWRVTTKLLQTMILPVDVE